jgi:hypothetical protein
MADFPIYPSSLPCVSRIDGFAMASAAAVLTTPIASGNPTQRRAHARLPTEIVLGWRAPNAQLKPLVAWLNTYGYDWFTLTLAGLEASQADAFTAPIEVRLMSDLKMTLLQFHRSNWWNVAASAEYQPPVLSLVPPGVGTVAVGSPGLPLA